MTGALAGDRGLVVGRLTTEGLRVVPVTEGGLLDWVRAHPEEGVYEVDRTYEGPTIMKFHEHLDRLEASADREGVSLRVDRRAVREALRRLVGLAGNGPVRFLVRMTFADPTGLDLVAERFRPPTEAQRRDGVACTLLRGARRRHPESKLSSWMTERAAFDMRPDAYEGLLLSDEDEILEGSTSNFYAVVGGELRTADRDILFGIARQIVLEVAPSVLAVRLEPVRVAELGRAEEAFLTSSSRGVLPIVQIDDQRLGNGRPGPLTERIRDDYDRWVRSHLEPL